MTWVDWDKATIALCVWREARGEPIEGQRAVIHVILNRVSLRHTMPHLEVEAKWQFSSMTTPGDSQLILWPKSPDPVFSIIMGLVEKAFQGEDDPTQGATHYFNPGVVLPSWASSMTKVASIGHHDFYK